MASTLRKFIQHNFSSKQNFRFGRNKRKSENKKDRSMAEKSKSDGKKQGHYEGSIGDFLAHTWSVERELGQGTFGKVYLCKNVESGLNCAIKVVRNIPRYTAAAKIEISILKNLTRKNHAGYYPIVQLFHDFSFNGHVCLVFPVHGISTYDYMKSIGYKPYKFNTIKSFCSQLLSALQFLHANKCTHTDIKPENVLFKSERPFAESIPGDPKSRRLLTTEIIVVDFGSAVFETDHHSKTVSTRHYRAPEIIFGQKWGTKIDIWSLGCMLFEYYTGDTMFDTHEDLEHLAIMERYIGAPTTSIMQKSSSFYQYNERGYSLKIDWESESGKKARKGRKPLHADHNALFDLIERMLTYDPKIRPDAHTCLNHFLFYQGRFSLK
ncbi:Oidioi.mRNA.OKI2018_I69.PAR.g9638.t1.cds [Oikopleura dioica]|uniref:dual-specificity kinase n=1 Tax=Oikopleura dioica TaxID=34765 RepID=A0ABN7RLK5_OIKDI|nr:Oidioi.mRNA.OKI2018_I69.PAR.g9638.t1.cds [Oikopleura dioica]